MNKKVETAEEQKRKSIFQHYKNDLLKLNDTHGRLRFNCIEYVCSTPQINPYEMAVSLIKDGVEIVYDNSAISKADNEKKHRKVNKLLSEEVA